MDVERKGTKQLNPFLAQLDGTPRKKVVLKPRKLDLQEGRAVATNILAAKNVVIEQEPVNSRGGNCIADIPESSSHTGLVVPQPCGATLVSTENTSATVDCGINLMVLQPGVTPGNHAGLGSSCEGAGPEVPVIQPGAGGFGRGGESMEQRNTPDNTNQSDGRRGAQSGSCVFAPPSSGSARGSLRQSSGRVREVLQVIIYEIEKGRAMIFLFCIQNSKKIQNFDKMFLKKYII